MLKADIVSMALLVGLISLGPSYGQVPAPASQLNVEGHIIQGERVYRKPTRVALTVEHLPVTLELIRGADPGDARVDVTLPCGGLSFRAAEIGVLDLNSVEVFYDDSRSICTKGGAWSISIHARLMADAPGAARQMSIVITDDESFLELFSNEQAGEVRPTFIQPSVCSGIFCG